MSDDIVVYFCRSCRGRELLAHWEIHLGSQFKISGTFILEFFVIYLGHNVVTLLSKTALSLAPTKVSLKNSNFLRNSSLKEEILLSLHQTNREIFFKNPKLTAIFLKSSSINPFAWSYYSSEGYYSSVDTCQQPWSMVRPAGISTFPSGAPSRRSRNRFPTR